MRHPGNPQCAAAGVPAAGERQAQQQPQCRHPQAGRQAAGSGNGRVPGR